MGSDFRTEGDHIFAVGDVIGFPALASTSMEQDRLAAYAAFDEPVDSCSPCSPSASTRSRRSATAGRPRTSSPGRRSRTRWASPGCRELARGQIVGDSYGMLKLLVSTQSRRLLGVHVFGTSATELVHVGQAIMTTGGTVDHLVDTVFSYPNLSEAYKIPALDAASKMRAVERLTR